MVAISPNRIPNFIKAGSPSGLRRLMFLNNAKRSAFIQYFDIQYVQEPGKPPYWIAWWLEDAKDDDILKERVGE